MNTTHGGRPDNVENSPRPINSDSAAPSAADAQQDPQQSQDKFQSEWLRATGIRQARGWTGSVRTARSKALSRRWKRDISPLIKNHVIFRKQTLEEPADTEQLRWIQDNARFIRGTSKEVREALKSIARLPSLKLPPDGRSALPRAYQITDGYLRATGFAFSEDTFGEYLAGVQQESALSMRELWALKPLLQYVLLEQLGIAARSITGSEKSASSANGASSALPSKVISSLHEVSQMEWKDFFEDNCVVDHILRSDPSGAYPRMDFESRQLYRDAIAELDQYTDLSETDIAKRAVLCARKALQTKWGASRRAIERRSNVGYFLLDAGISILKKNIHYRPSLAKRVKDIVLEWPEVYYVVGVEFTTLLMVFLLLRHLGNLIPLIPGLLLLIPASQAAVGLMNHLTAWLILPRRLPRLDLSAGIPDEFKTLVVVPSMLINEKEVRHIVDALEIRYLGNQDPNLHFALLTDSPDTAAPSEEYGDLVRLCGSLVEGLNTKYASDRQGRFIHLHRHRIFNPQENSWMGWERKRGKLLDLNKLLLNNADNFPVKAGDISILRRVRYVITLDSDTRLPRGTAHKLVATLAHPLNRAVIDRRTNTVVEGYGILQPRVGVSIESAHKSRMAAIYSGETGIDIYTQAVSDVYQDLFGEGSFTGKGIYEVEAFQRVLDNRFPTNALLSHDLIEGVYARAGLASDIEVIDDYPSHFSSYCRRMHRWVRGDWQILRWLLPHVPDFFGRSVPNPLGLLPRWKIFDNLRRSLIELNLFLLLVAGWCFLPGAPVYWTILTMALLLMPTYFQLFFSMLGLLKTNNPKGFLKERANNFVTGHLQVFVMLVFLPHKAFVMLDAIARTLTRLTFTHKNLLEWETAAEAEAGLRKSAIETYLDLTPVFALAMGLGLVIFRPSALSAALPVLGLWLFAGVFTRWINQPPRRRKNRLNPQDKVFLRHAALATWRYFREFSNAGVHWLIPDRVQEAPLAVVQTLSPTNLGILLNARLAAYHLGHLTLMELIDQTESTFRSAKQLTRFRGHFLNWYDIQTLQPISPQFVSTVDSGNFAASLLTMAQACQGLLKRPIIAPASWQSIRDHISLVGELVGGKTLPVEVVAEIQNLSREVNAISAEDFGWIDSLPQFREKVSSALSSIDAANAGTGNAQAGPAGELTWWLTETLARIENVQRLLQIFAPWMAPEYKNLATEIPLADVSLSSLPGLIAELDIKLDNAPQAQDDNTTGAAQSLRVHLKACAERVEEFTQRLLALAADSTDLLQAMDFRFLYNPKKKLLHIGYDLDAQQVAPSYYDLLGSEARTATFIAIAKGDIEQDSWFHLGRSRTVAYGEATLASWSGTMFEYLMPLLWMRCYPGTLLDDSTFAMVLCQRKHGKKKGIPWGVSEAAFNERDSQGIYQYYAFGLPGLALDPKARKDTVVAPYASFLALQIDPEPAVQNLNAMRQMGWLGRFGFYESADYTNSLTTGSRSYELVRCWMAHHQGMSLVAVCNLLTQSSLRNWFHRDPKVTATELLLHEKISTAPPEDTSFSTEPPKSPHYPNKKASGPLMWLPRSHKARQQSSPKQNGAGRSIDQPIATPVSSKETSPPQA